MKNYLICDDNIYDIDIIENEIKEHYYDKDEQYTIYRALSVNDVSKYVEKNKIDILFLDIDLPGIHGFEIASIFSNKVECITFVSCHDELVYESFKYRPFRFIRKGHIEEIRETLDAYGEMVKTKAVLNFKTTDGAVATVFLDDIVYIESYREKLYINLENERFEARARMKHIVESLNDNFMRVHRGYIINLKKIHQIAKNYVEIKFHDSLMQIPITRNSQQSIQEKFAEVMRK